MSGTVRAALAIGLPLALSTAGCGSESPPTRAGAGSSTAASVMVNELQPKNSSIESDTNKKSDWVELYNPSDSDAALEGYFISDDKDALEKAELPAQAIVPAGGFLVLWLDGTTDPDHPLHFPFKLSGDGETFYLVTPSGEILRDVVVPPDPTSANTSAPDVSYGAYPDGSDKFGWCRTPTLRDHNDEDCESDAGL